MVCDSLSQTSCVFELKKGLAVNSSDDAIAKSPLLTLFAIPRAFDEQSTIIQENAINSWLSLGPDVKVQLFGDDAGVAEFAEQRSIEHFPNISKNEFGTPLLDSVFQQAAQNATTPLLTYVNCDIILFRDFVDGVARVKATLDGENFLAIGRRTNLTVDQRFDFLRPETADDVQTLARENGTLETVACKDYFVFPRTMYDHIPGFAVGRGNWDNWMVHDAKDKSIPVVSMTNSVLAVHQENESSHQGRRRYRNYVSGPEARKNQQLAGGRHLVHGSTSTRRLKRGQLQDCRWHWLGCEFWFDFPRFARLLGNFVGK